MDGEIVRDFLVHADWITALATLAAAFGGAWAGHMFAAKHRREQDNRALLASLGALDAEIKECVRLATVYLGQNILAPAYRLPRWVFESMRAGLVRAGMGGEGLTALLRFYSQVDQANFGLDQINAVWVATGDARNAQADVDRLRGKMNELSAEGEGLGAKALAAIERFRTTQLK